MPCPGSLAATARRQTLGQLLVAGPGAHRVAQVALLPGEQAVADLPVGGQPDPVAGPAERPGHRADHADPGRAAVDQERLGGGRAALARVVGRQRELRRSAQSRISSAVTMLSRRQPCCASSGICSMNRSWYPWSRQNRSSVAGLVVVDAAHQHGVDLDRAQPGRGRGGQAGQHVGAAGPAGRARWKVSGRSVSSETLIRSRPAARSGPASRASPMPFVVSEISGRGRSAAVRATMPARPAAQQRLAAGEPDLADAEPLHADPDQPDDLVVGEQLGLGQPVQPFGAACSSVQRRLHRSVSDTRRSVATRPNESASTAASPRRRGRPWPCHLAYVRSVRPIIGTPRHAPALSAPLARHAIRHRRPVAGWPSWRGSGWVLPAIAAEARGHRYPVAANSGPPHRRTEAGR